MNLSSFKYGLKLGHPKISHHSNLSPSLDSKVANWSRINKNIVWTVLNQVVVFQSQLFGDLKHFENYQSLVSNLKKFFEITKHFSLTLG